MLADRWRSATAGRVNPLVPAVVALMGLVTYITGYHWIGAGTIVGAGLGYLNGLVLSRRVEIAADMADVGRALMVMQIGLLLSASVIGVVTVVLVRFSVAMAVASAAGFVATHFGILAVFYFRQARVRPALEGKSS